MGSRVESGLYIDVLGEMCVSIESPKWKMGVQLQGFCTRWAEMVTCGVTKAFGCTYGVYSLSRWIADELCVHALAAM